eukprot:519383-Pelagomonas_calceolata.AAC.10
MGRKRPGHWPCTGPLAGAIYQFTAPSCIKLRVWRSFIVSRTDYIFPSIRPGNASREPRSATARVPGIQAIAEEVYHRAKITFIAQRAVTA